MPEPLDIPDYEPPLRRMMAEAHGLPYHPLPSLDEARRHDDGVAILEGDWGGQIYVVVPAKTIQCSVDTLRRLLLDLDSAAWSSNGNEGAAIYHERKPTGTDVAGGMGDGSATGDLWVHPEFDGIIDRIRDVIAGRRESIAMA